jgi:flagellar biosynthesis/type III secretory pathway protein FliH
MRRVKKEPAAKEEPVEEPAAKEEPAAAAAAAAKTATAAKSRAADASPYGKGGDSFGKGKSKGWEEGFAAGKGKDCSQCWDEGFANGKEKGFSEGFKAGKGKLFTFYTRLTTMRRDLEELEEDMEAQVP